MYIVSIALVLLLLLACTLTAADNPTAIVQPYSGLDPGYIVAESDTGLGNRLRVLAAYMHVGAARYEGAHLVFVWDVTPACPAHFLEIFQPIQNVIFATNSSRYVLDKGAKVVYENSNAVLDWTLRMNHIPKNRFGFPSWGQIEHDMYRRFRPTAAVMAKVGSFVRTHDMCGCVAMHIRLTDLADDMRRKNKHVNVQSYLDYVDALPADSKVYLMTDNADTQRLFLDKYGSQRILVHSPIAAVVRGLPRGSDEPRDALLTNGTAPSLASLPADTRHTSLEHTLVDVLIAAHAREFKPAMYSSLSDVVRLYSGIGRQDWGWCSDSR